MIYESLLDVVKVFLTVPKTPYLTLYRRYDWAKHQTFYAIGDFSQWVPSLLHTAYRSGIERLCKGRTYYYWEREGNL